MLVLVAPGQGAQTPGFLAPWLDVPGVSEPAALALRRRRASTWSATAPQADAEEIRDTAVAQPLLVAAGLVAALALFPHPADAFGSVGAARRAQRR